MNNNDYPLAVRTQMHPDKDSASRGNATGTYAIVRVEDTTDE